MLVQTFWCLPIWIVFLLRNTTIVSFFHQNVQEWTDVGCNVIGCVRFRGSRKSMEYILCHSSDTFANAVPSPQLKYCLKVQGDMIDILTDNKRAITTGVKSGRLGTTSTGPSHSSTWTENFTTREFTWSDSNGLWSEQMDKMVWLNTFGCTRLSIYFTSMTILAPDCSPLSLCTIMFDWFYSSKVS